MGWHLWHSPRLLHDHPPALRDVWSAHLKADEHPGRGLVDRPGGQRLQDSHRLDRCRGCRPPCSRKLCKHPNTCKCGALILIRSSPPQNFGELVLKPPNTPIWADFLHFHNCRSGAGYICLSLHPNSKVVNHIQ